MKNLAKRAVDAMNQAISNGADDLYDLYELIADMGDAIDRLNKQLTLIQSKVLKGI